MNKNQKQIVAGLNQKQLEAVTSVKGATLIVAGAGTGKTEVITRKIEYLVKGNFVRPNEILALTFTEKAAKEMLERVEDKFVGKYYDWNIGTFHSFCERILREWYYLFGLSSDFAIFNTQDIIMLLSRNWSRFNFEGLADPKNSFMSMGSFISFYNDLLEQSVGEKEFAEFVETLDKDSLEYERYSILSQNYPIYQQIKIDNNCVEFSDMHIFVNRLLEQYPKIAAKIKSRYKYVLVDEFQDTNYAQLILLENLADTSYDQFVGVTVVGDDDQAIYKFRGASIYNINAFIRHYKDVNKVVLTENYRSGQVILDSAYKLIRNNSFRLEETEGVDKKLISRYPNTGSVDFIWGKDIWSEVLKVADRIYKLTGAKIPENVEKWLNLVSDSDSDGSISLIADKAYKPSDIAILVRTNGQIEELVPLFRKVGIELYSEGRRSIFNYNLIINIISYLSVISGAEEDYRLLDLLRTSYLGFSDRFIRDLIIKLNGAVRNKANKSSVLDKIEEIFGIRFGVNISEDSEALSRGLKIFGGKDIDAFRDVLMLIDSGIRMIAAGTPTRDIIHSYFYNSNLSKYINNLKGEDAIEASVFFEGFDSFMRDYFSKHKNSQVYDFVKFIDISIERGSVPQVDSSSVSEGIRIMTAHKSKGLEFHVVFIMNAVNRRFPTDNRSSGFEIPADLVKDSLQEDSLNKLDSRELHINEERRLFYVAMTRAKEKLFVSGASSYSDKESSTKPSVFALESNIVGDTIERVSNSKYDFGYLKLEFSQDRDTMTFIKDSFDYKISFTKWQAYRRCPQIFYYSNVLKFPMKDNINLMIGNILHAVIKELFDEHRRYGCKKKVPLDRHSTRLMSMLEAIPESEDYDRTQIIEKYSKILNDYYDRMYLGNEIIYELEKNYTVRVGEYDLVVKVDRIDKVYEDEQCIKLAIFDYKTGKIISNTDKDKIFQLDLYAYVVGKSLTNLFSKKVIIDSVNFIFLEYIMSDEENPVYTRKDFSKDDAVISELDDVVSKIKNGQFKATPSKNICKYCDFNQICKDAEL